MSARWWAPARPGTSPDSFDLELLKPGDDPVHDLASAVLVLHRTGAAACEAAAATPMPDETTLITKISEAREQLAEHLVESISKAVGQVNYAGLLVRDIADDAEEAALAVYRAAVSKGVSPPLAAQRAGAVYGVPRQELGKYLSAAADPRAAVVALTDIADRSLFTFVEKVAKAEATQEVSKAPVAVMERPRTQVLTQPQTQTQTQKPWNPLRHPRDPNTGEFVELPVSLSPVTETPLLARLRRNKGVGAQAAPEVGDVPRGTKLQEQQVEPVQEKEKASAREKYKARQKKRGNKVRTVATVNRLRSKPVETESASDTPAEIRTNMKQRVQRPRRKQKVRITQQKLRQLQQRSGKSNFNRAPGIKNPDWGVKPDPNADFETWNTIYAPVSWLMTNDQFSDMLAKDQDGDKRAQEGAGTRKDPIMFRIGHLNDYMAAGPVISYNDDHEATSDFEGWLQSVADEANDDLDQDYPADIDVITVKREKYRDDVAFDDAVNRARDEMIKRIVANRLPQSASVEDRMRMWQAVEEDITEAGSIRNDRDVVIVYEPTVKERRTTAPMVYEVFINNDAEGVLEGTFRHEKPSAKEMQMATPRLNPNRMYEMDLTSALTGENLYYDPDVNAWITRVELRRLSESQVQKAREDRKAAGGPGGHLNKPTFRSTNIFDDDEIGKWFSKATMVAERPRVVSSDFESKHPRDRLGQFAVKDETKTPLAERLRSGKPFDVSRETMLQEQQQEQTRRQRYQERQKKRGGKLQRVNRVNRMPSTGRVPVSVNQGEVVEAQQLRQQRQRSAMRQRLTQKQRWQVVELNREIANDLVDPNNPVLRDDAYINVLTHGEFTALLKQSKFRARPTTMPERIALPDDVRDELQGGQTHGAKQSLEFEQQLRDITDRQVMRYDDVGEIDVDMGDPRQLRGVAHRMRELFKKDENIASVHLEPVKGVPGRWKLMANRSPVQPLVMVLQEDWLGNDATELEYVGTYRTQTLPMEWHETGVDDLPPANIDDLHGHAVNPPVALYRMVRAEVDVLR